MSPAQSAPYEALVEMIDRELELAREARFDELAQATATRAEFVKTLPGVPPEAAREPLRRALELQNQLMSETLQAREALMGAVSEVERAGRAARGYAPPRAHEHLSTSA